MSLNLKKCIISISLIIVAIVMLTYLNNDNVKMGLNYHSQNEIEINYDIVLEKFQEIDQTGEKTENKYYINDEVLYELNDFSTEELKDIRFGLYSATYGFYEALEINQNTVTMYKAGKEVILFSYNVVNSGKTLNLIDIPYLYKAELEENLVSIISAIRICIDDDLSSNTKKSVESAGYELNYDKKYYKNEYIVYAGYSIFK